MTGEGTTSTDMVSISQPLKLIASSCLRLPPTSPNPASGTFGSTELRRHALGFRAYGFDEGNSRRVTLFCRAAGAVIRAVAVLEDVVLHFLYIRLELSAVLADGNAEIFVGAINVHHSSLF